jgi:integrase/recombinase XerD
MTTPTVTIFVRHAAGCKYAGDEFTKRCTCRKHVRWTSDGEQHRRAAGTRSWTEAENFRRTIEDQFLGREHISEKSANGVRDSVALFLQDKKLQGVTQGVMKKYTLELSRLTNFCNDNRIFTIQGITREVMTQFCGTWETFYPSSYTRAKVRERCRSFFHYCYEAQWIPRVPNMPKAKIDVLPTMPLAADEYARLLDAIYVTTPRRWDGKMSTQAMTEQTRIRVRALFQLMRWSGLAIRDAVTLERAEIQRDAARGIYRVVTSRQKTGTHVSVPIPADVAREVLNVTNANPKYIFWTGDCPGETIAKTWANRYVRPVFEAAGIACGHMVSHRLRDTFAVDLLTKGVPMEEVSRLLGHTSIRTTEKHYAKWSKGRQDRADALVTATWAVEARPAPAQKGP